MFERLGELAWVFLKLSVIGVGGPAAHIALMENEVVRKRGWLSSADFLDLLGATNLIPGPNSTEMAIHVGRLRAGAAGLIVAGACFIVPAALITVACAWTYVNYGTLPEARGLMYGLRPVIVVVVLQALIGLGRTAIKTPLLGGLALAACAAIFFGAHELLVLLGAGLVAAAVRRGGGLVALLPAPGLALGTAAVAPVGLLPLFLFFLKVGSVLFGSGYVLVAFLRADLVDRWHWLTEAQLLEAVAIGQITPGPVSTTATFIGYLLGRAPGALVATVGIFLPSFVFVALSGPLVSRLRRSPTAGAFLDGVNVAALALMIVVVIQLGRAAITDGWTAGLAALGAVLLIAVRIGVGWLLIGGALIGIALHMSI